MQYECSICTHTLPSLPTDQLTTNQCITYTTWGWPHEAHEADQSNNHLVWSHSQNNKTIQFCNRCLELPIYTYTIYIYQPMVSHVWMVRDNIAECGAGGHYDNYVPTPCMSHGWISSVYIHTQPTPKHSHYTYTTDYRPDWCIVLCVHACFQQTPSAPKNGGPVAFFVSCLF